ncbi:MAG: hypothetical protein KDA96_21120 [Planctomycetaceae bacterium]|nr:hypothetical protein [Planctomycetaceae bacterium]MCA9065589.1 hypothetical protein [Planctomycetaceae bacterium]
MRQDTLLALAKKMVPPLRKLGFRPEPDEAGFCLFARRQDDCIQRIGMTLERTAKSQREVPVGVVLGVEFPDYGRESLWIGMPRTHGGVVPLKLLNKAAKKVYSCPTDSGSSASGLADVVAEIVAAVPEALAELVRRQEKLRRQYESLLNGRQTNLRKRMTLLAERRAKELRSRKSRTVADSNPSLAAKLNLPQILEGLLKSKTDQRQELDVREFDEADAHDEALVETAIAALIVEAGFVAAELTEYCGKPLETGSAQHRQIPVNGIRHFVLWTVGWKLIFLVVTHEDVGLPCALELGVTDRTCHPKR